MRSTPSRAIVVFTLKALGSCLLFNLYAIKFGILIVQSVMEIPLQHICITHFHQTCNSTELYIYDKVFLSLVNQLLHLNLSFMNN